MATPAERLARLKEIRDSGIRETEFQQARIIYRTDAELNAAIARLEAEITPKRKLSSRVRFSRW